MSIGDYPGHSSLMKRTELGADQSYSSGQERPGPIFLMKATHDMSHDDRNACPR